MAEQVVGRSEERLVEDGWHEHKNLVRGSLDPKGWAMTFPLIRKKLRSRLKLNLTI